MTNPSRAVLFDLDGTLVDPAGAITGGILAALLRHGVPHPGDERLEALVGPPLAVGLLGLPGMSEELLPSVIADYRAEYAASGMAASRVYPGIADLLAELRDSGLALAVATSKPQDIAVRLLEVQGLLGLFDAVHGSPNDERHTVHSGPGKAHIVGAALAAVGAEARDAVMVGDRHYDVDGADAHGLACIGVAWGYAAAGELETAGAHAVVDSAGELRELLLGAAGREV
ncbi:MAG: HAD hydrolase-like protein [Arthrobacter sp.]|uniref:HAD hydrolase-like protein n=1 Tax=Arthrobacter sp. TaxID=1667 RepID=UPI00348DC625